jgi:hypothetical protein
MNDFGSLAIGGERNPKPDIEKEQVLIEGKRKVL